MSEFTSIIRWSISISERLIHLYDVPSTSNVLFFNWEGKFFIDTRYNLWQYTLFSLWLTENFSWMLWAIYLIEISEASIFNRWDTADIIKLSLLMFSLKLRNKSQDHLESKYSRNLLGYFEKESFIAIIEWLWVIWFSLFISAKRSAAVYVFFRLL